MDISSLLNQEVTHWTTGEAHFEGFSFGSPEVLSARWEDRSVLYITKGGEQKVSNAVVYLSDDVAEGDYIALGSYTDVADPTSLVNAFRVMQFQKLPDADGLEYLRKAVV